MKSCTSEIYAFYLWSRKECQRIKMQADQISKKKKTALCEVIHVDQNETKTQDQEVRK